MNQYDSAMPALARASAYSHRMVCCLTASLTLRALCARALAIGLTNRGLLKEGFWADVTIFDPINVRSMCNFDDDARPEYPEGIPFVIVNGVLVIKNSEHTNSMPGMVLRHPF